MGDPETNQDLDEIQEQVDEVTNDLDVTDDDTSGKDAATDDDDKAEGETATPDTTDDDGADESIPKPRFNEIYGKFKNAEREAEYWRKKAQEDSEKKTQPSANLPSEPKEDDFETWADYNKAHTKWVIESDRIESEHKSEQAKIDQALFNLNKGIEEGSKEFSDFEDIVFKNPLMPKFDNYLLQMMAQADIENPAAFIYYLGKNTNEAFELAQLTGNPLMLGRKIARIEGKLSQQPPPPRRVDTKAPEPIKTVGDNEPTRKNLNDMSMEEAAAYWNKKDYGTSDPFAGIK